MRWRYVAYTLHSKRDATFCQVLNFFLFYACPVTVSTLRKEVHSGQGVQGRLIYTNSLFKWCLKP